MIAANTSQRQHEHTAGCPYSLPVRHAAHGADPRQYNAIPGGVFGADGPLHDLLVAWLQADHRHPWNRGGTTDIGNCDGLCDPHNKKKTDLVPP